jgi:hypothetical protein
LRPSPAPVGLYAYEGFEYPPTVPDPSGERLRPWPKSGGLQDLGGGLGWAAPWQESGSKVAIVLAYPAEVVRTPKDMRKFGPLGYSDRHGNVLMSSGYQLRTATGLNSLSSRKLTLDAFPPEMQDERGLGRDGSVLWLSFLTLSFDSGGGARFAYLQLGTETAGFRIGKLPSVPSGNWSASGLLDQAQVNLRSSKVPSGETAFMVVRLTFRPGPELAEVWINPLLDKEPLSSETTMQLSLPDFRFDEVLIASRYSTDLDEIRLGGSFRDVAPLYAGAASTAQP